jgi:hypothetical protein
MSLGRSPSYGRFGERIGRVYSLGQKYCSSADFVRVRGTRLRLDDMDRSVPPKAENRWTSNGLRRHDR